MVPWATRETCLRMREKVKKAFSFTTFVRALRERAVFGTAELTTELLKENHSLTGPQ